jgi:hypothetical protein
MSSYKTGQRRVVHRGREFHFVSYEGTPANPRNQKPATQAAWYLMCAGKRWEVIAQVGDQSDSALELALHTWLDANIFGITERSA